MQKSKSSKELDSDPDSNEQEEVSEEHRLAFDALAQIVGLDYAGKRLKELRKPPKGATLDPQKSRERLAVAQGLERGMTLGEAIRAVTETQVKADPNKYHELYEAFTKGGAAPFWISVARNFKEAEQIEGLRRTGEFTMEWEALKKRRP